MRRATVETIGTSASPLLVIDSATGEPDRIVGLAAGLAPFPPARGNSYPGLRRPITGRDTAAATYARTLLGGIASEVNAVFGLDGFDLLDASFSIVTARPDTLAPQQRAPHFDSVEPHYLAIMQFLSAQPGGTGFFRQRATGIERVDAANLPRFVAAAQAEAAGWQGYIEEGNASFDRIGTVAMVPDRVVAYHGGLLHSGLIPAGVPLDPDPRRGRLTANFFVRGRVRG